MLNPDIPCLCSVDPGHALFAIKYVIYSNNPDQAIWLAEN